ncbi:hypothetical protein LSH36_3g27018 [Paralvinella palmiformis]|uniref:Uncharacterized protein n=1 Tax=Paralvinella palmiformis TaxID=53620 RepID=A0AAD9KFY4_9ANNE|nr:hypothetical protein LSH36_3g27018 [Paralvinella palmiformis]
MAASDEKRPSSVTGDNRPVSEDGSTARSERSAPGWAPDGTSSPQRIITQLSVPKSNSTSDEQSLASSAKKPFKKAAANVQRQVAVTNVFQDDAGAKRRDRGRLLSDQMLENTYKMQPVDDFSVSRSRQIILQVFGEHLADAVYDPDTCADLTKMLSQSIMARLKEMVSLRHKYVCHIILGERSDQSMQVSSRCAWDVQTDNSASARFDNKSIFAVGLVYGIYFE